MQRIRRILVSLMLIIVPSCLVICGWLYYQVTYTNPAKLEDLIKENDRIATEVTKDVEGLLDTSVEGAQTTVTRSLEDVVTIKQRLEALAPLHKGKIEAERLFGFHQLQYLDSMMYRQSIYTQVHFDFNENTFSIEGQTIDLALAKDLEKALRYVGLKETCTEANVESRIYPFTITSFDTPASVTHENPIINYNVSGTFDPRLFESVETAQERLVSEDPEAAKNYDPNAELKLIIPNGLFSTDVFGRGHQCKDQESSDALPPEEGV